MARLPVIISVPHGGLGVPPEVAANFLPKPLDVLCDGDTWARELYRLEGRVAEYVDTGIARLVVDVNRDPNDLPPKNPDGVVKTVTVAGAPVWRHLTPRQAEALIVRYHRPYHDALEFAVKHGEARLGVDCHTMLPVGPPGAADCGRQRPLICLSHGNDGKTAPLPLVNALMESLFREFADNELFAMEGAITINSPFTGGYICRRHSTGEVPWVQLEINRKLYLSANPLSPEAPGQCAARMMNDLRQRMIQALADIL